MKRILIDETTLKRNPFYGPYARYAPGPVEITLKGGQLADAQMMKRFFAGELTETEMGEIQEVRREAIDVTCINEPEFLFKYKPDFVKCYVCQKKFPHLMLGHGWDQNDDIPCDDENICPYCGFAWCCETEYETVEECLERINKTENEIPYEERNL